MLRLWHNGTLMEHYIVSSPITDTLDDELDKATFQIKSTTRQTFHKNDKIRYLISIGTDGNRTSVVDKTMCLFDWVETLEGEYWLYQLTLLSPTKLLENIIINGMASTGYSDSSKLYTQFGNVITKINYTTALEMATPPVLSYTSSNAEELLNISANDFLWDNQQTAREILQDICGKADCLITATDYTISNGNITAITLKIVQRELKKIQQINTNDDIESGGLNAISSVVKGITIHRDSGFNNGNLISLTKNAICKDNVQQTYLPARNSDLTIDDSADWYIMTQEPIYSLNRVIAMMPVSNIYIDYWRYQGTAWHTETYYSSAENPTMRVLIPVDITNYIVEKDVFDALPLSKQKKSLYFKRGEKGIYGLYKRYKKTPLVSQIALYYIMTDDSSHLNALTSANDSEVLDWSEYNAPVNIIGERNLSSVSWDDMETISFLKLSLNYKADGAVKELRYTGTPYTNSNDAYKQCLFSVNYQPYCDSVVKIEKTNITENVKNLSTIKNQSDRTIDASKYYDSQISLCNRLGNDEMTLDVMLDSKQSYSRNATNLWYLGDYITMNGHDWTLTKREIENYGEDKIKARYYLSKDYNASNSAINVNRDKRLYGIPLNNFVDRYILIRKPNNKDYTKILVYCHDDFTANQNETGTTVQDGYCVLDLVKIGNSSVIDRVARCKDNYAVDIERTTYSGTIVNINLRYTNTDGTGQVWVKLLTDADYNSITISEYKRLPFIQGSVNVGDALTLTIDKDKMERIIFVVR